jgi:hypothetical protein
VLLLDESGNVGVRVSEQVQHILETLLVDARAGLFLDFGLGVECDTETSSGKHHQIIGAIPNGHDLFQPDRLGLRNHPQQLCFAFRVHDGAGCFACQRSTVRFNLELRKLVSLIIK